VLRGGVLHREPELLQRDMLQRPVLRDYAGDRNLLRRQPKLLQWTMLLRRVLQQRLLPKRADLLQWRMLCRSMLWWNGVLLEYRVVLPQRRGCGRKCLRTCHVFNRGRWSPDRLSRQVL